MSDDWDISTEGYHRGVPLRAGQCERRLEVVRADIDSAFALTATDALWERLRDPMKAPESRLLAGALLEARCISAVAITVLRGGLTVAGRQYRANEVLNLPFEDGKRVVESGGAEFEGALQ